jgi:phage tail tube protein FII
MRAEMAELVAHMADKLKPDAKGKPKIFRDTIVGNGEKSYGNITDFLATFEARNVTDDKELAALVKQAKGLLKGVDADSLRDDEKTKARVAKGMQAIKSTLDGMVTEKPNRSFQFED